MLHIFKPFKGLDVSPASLLCACANTESRMPTGTESKTEVYQETEEKTPLNSLFEKSNTKLKLRPRSYFPGSGICVHSNRRD